MSTFADTMSHRGWLTEGGLETDLIFLQGIDLLVRETRALRDKVPSLFVIGGCCGTDARHVGALADLIAPDRA